MFPNGEEFLTPDVQSFTMEGKGVTIDVAICWILSHQVDTKDVVRLPNRVKGRKPAGKAQAKRARRRVPAQSVLAAVFTVLFPPAGVLLTWRSRWQPLTKYAMTAVAVAVMAVAVLVLPPTDAQTPGGIELVGVDPEAEIYGPALPTAMVTGYTASSTSSVFAQDTEDEIVYVYAADDGECYHLYDCKFAYASSRRLTVYEAHYLGYTPCGLCNPPAYEG